MHRRFAPIPLAAALFAAGAAHAQTSPYFIGASQAFTHESGVQASGSDTSSVTSLRAGVDQPIGRGRVFGEASLNYTRYNKNEQLNSRGHAVRGTWEWETIANLSGAFTGSSTQRLSRLAGAPLEIAPARNIERVNDGGARVRLGTSGPLAFEARVGARTVSYSAPESEAREYDQHRAQLGVLYRVGGALLLGAGASAQNYTYPHFEQRQPEVYVPDHVRRRDAYVSANWVPTGKSSVDARVNIGKIEHDHPLLADRDFSGATGFVTWNWRPTGKLTFETTFSRDSGEETSFPTGPVPTSPVPTAPVDPGVPTPPLPTTPTVPIGANFTPLTSTGSIVNQLAVRGLYDFSAKIAFNASIVRARHAFTAGGNANVTSLALGVRWMPLRAWTFGCDVSHETRSDDPEDAKSIGCFGQFLLHL